MATKFQDVTAAPTVLAGIVEDTQYSVQNLAPSPISLVVAAVAPGAGDRAFSIEPLAFLYPTAAAGESIYIWGSGEFVAYEESA